jgi:RNA polymerase sigma-70 factor (ECF subfamily)
MTAQATFEDSELIRLALAGQPEYFVALMDRHLAAVRRRVRSMAPCTADVDDLVQEVTLKVWRCLSTFRSESTFHTWLVRIAINETLMLYRRKCSRPTCYLDDVQALVCTRESPHQSLSRSEEIQAVRQAIAALPTIYREVLILRDIQELSIREAASCLNSPIPTVKTRLSRARLMLLARLKRSKMQSRWPQHVRAVLSSN